MIREVERAIEIESKGQEEEQEGRNRRRRDVKLTFGGFVVTLLILVLNNIPSHSLLATVFQCKKNIIFII